MDQAAKLRALARDPLVIKETRIDAIFGLTDLMESAYRQGACLDGQVLLLYGEKDEIIPAAPTCKFLAGLASGCNPYSRAILYPDGYHMLLRDLQAGVVYDDILAWIGKPDGAPPSGMQVGADALREPAMCGDAPPAAVEPDWN